MKAPKYVIAPEGCKSYLTPGKRYKVRQWKPGNRHAGYFHVTDDDGTNLGATFAKCYHLNGGDWIVPDDDAEAVPVDNGGPAFPCADYTTEHGDMVIPTTVQGGMSLRAYAAVAAMQGMLASKMAFPAKASVIEASVNYADALLAKLGGRVMPASTLDLTNVDADSAYHNWLEAQDILHSEEREQAFKEGWRILSDFIAGPEQSAVDWSIVCEAVGDATDIDGIGAGALEASFARCGLLVVHKGEVRQADALLAALAVKGEAR